MLYKMKMLVRPSFSLKNDRIEPKLILAYPALMIISILVVSSFAVYISWELFKDKSIAYSQHLLQQISQNTDMQLKRLNQDMYIFFQNQDVRSFLVSAFAKDSAEYYQMRKQIVDFMTNFELSHDNIDSVFLIDEHGDVIGTSDIDESLIEDYQRLAKEGDGKTVWLNTRESVTGTRVIPVLREISELSSMRRKATLVIYLHEHEISRRLEADNLGMQGSLTVIDPNGSIISSSDQERISTNADADLLRQIRHGDGFFFKKEPNGSAFYLYDQSALTQWIYLYRIPGTELFRGFELVRNWIAAAVVLLILVSVLSARKMVRNVSRPFRRAMMEQHELEMRALQAEINPHFLYNTLDAINWLGRMNNNAGVCEMTTMLADMMRYSIGRQKSLVTVGEELENVKTYLGIQQIRYGDRLKILIHVDRRIFPVPIPKLTFQPIVENAIVHGLEPKAGAGMIRIIGEIEDGDAVIAIEDNGVGMERQTLEALITATKESGAAGLGFFNVNQRVKLVYGESYGLQVKSVLGKGTRVTIRLPLGKGEVRDVQSVDCG